MRKLIEHQTAPNDWNQESLKEFPENKRCAVSYPIVNVYKRLKMDIFL